MLFLASLAAGLLLIAALCACVVGARAVTLATRQLEQLRKHHLAQMPAALANAGVAPTARSLPWFRSAPLLQQFNRAAAEVGLPVDEVGYVLEEGANQPYLRYRISMTVTSSYPVIRRFVDDIGAVQPNVDLDSINCTRSDVNIVPLTCELAFSAFFRKDAHG